MVNLADLRTEYSRQRLDENSVLDDPLAQFKIWLEEALTSGALEPTAMVLSTVNSSGQPSGRVVLLKGLNEGFTFYTNYQSRKSMDMESNDMVSLTFFWPELERQVRVEGEIKKEEAEISDVYYKSRPRESRLGAWASPQSQPVGSREALDELMKAAENQFEGVENIPRPAHWGGYRVVPFKVEFWQGRPNRLHDRIVYTIEKENWVINRLAP